MFCYLPTVTLKMGEDVRHLVRTAFSWVLLNPRVFLAAGNLVPN